MRSPRALYCPECDHDPCRCGALDPEHRYLLEEPVYCQHCDGLGLDPTFEQSWCPECGGDGISKQVLR